MDLESILKLWPKQIRLKTNRYKNENTVVIFEVYVTRIKDSYKIINNHGEVQNDSQKVHKLIRGIQSDDPAYLHKSVGIVHMDTVLNNEFNLAVDML